jgi:hypothetical protein
MVANWSDEAVAAVERWGATKPGRSGSQPGWRRLGTADRSTSGWLVLDLRGGSISSDRLDDVRLSGTRGPDQEASYPVDELRYDDDVLSLRQPPGLPSSSMQVWTRKMSARFLIDRLAQGLRAAGPAPLAEALANGVLAGPPTSTATVPGLLPEQTEALRACLSPGVRLVWGPPGTGKTRVLASAIEELVRRGQRVLLVSTANIAVDNALNEVVRRLSAKRGTAIRVGPAQLKDIADDPNVQLERLAAAESAAVDSERDRMAERLRAFDAQDAEISVLRTKLDGYDDEEFRRAAARVEAERALEQCDHVFTRSPTPVRRPNRSATKLPVYFTQH